MKILVINLKRHSYLISAVKLISLFLILFITASFLTNAYLGSEKYISALQEMNEKNLVLIDAGHGGEDPGAIANGEIYEKDLNLALAFMLGETLTEHGFAVMYTRTEDKLLYNDNENIKGIRKISDLKNRCKIAAEYPDAIFISIHMNSYGNPKYSGLQVYYSPKNEESHILAGKIQSSVKESLQPDNERTIKKGDKIYLLENTENTAILIECGFLTNPEECQKLLKKEYQKQLSLSIVYGIIEYRNTKSN